MAREKEDLRLNIEQLNRIIPDREMLTMAEAMQVMGYRSVNTAKKYIHFTNGKVSKVALARVMCG